MSDDSFPNVFERDRLRKLLQRKGRPHRWNEDWCLECALSLTAWEAGVGERFCNDRFLEEKVTETLTLMPLLLDGVESMVAEIRKIQETAKDNRVPRPLANTRLEAIYRRCQDILDKYE